MVQATKIGIIAGVAFVCIILALIFNAIRQKLKNRRKPLLNSQPAPPANPPAQYQAPPANPPAQYQAPPAQPHYPTHQHTSYPPPPYAQPSYVPTGYPPQPPQQQSYPHYPPPPASYVTQTTLVPPPPVFQPAPSAPPAESTQVAGVEVESASEGPTSGRFNIDELLSFPTKGKEGDEPCPICFDALKEEEVSTGQCLHLVHTSCLKQWLVKDKLTACPVCRVSYMD